MSSLDQRWLPDANLCWELSRGHPLRRMHPDIWAVLDDFRGTCRGEMGFHGYVQYFLRISSARQEITNVLSDFQRSLASPFIGDWHFIRRTSRSRRLLTQQPPGLKKIKTTMSLLRLRDLGRSQSSSVTARYPLYPPIASAQPTGVYKWSQEVTRG
jgi:hypothetical protein